MENITIIAQAGFLILTAASVAVFYRALRNSKTFLAIILAWILVQGAISLAGFYTLTNSLPPRLTLLVAPPLLFIALLFLTVRGRKFIDQLDLKWLTIIHFVRIPVELILFYLFLQKAIPELMTFEGRNLDIISGITAALALWVYSSNWKWKRGFLIGWNLVCLALLVNIVTIAILSAPFPFQQLAFHQPNIAVLHFPFIYLPGVIVPFVFFAHLVAIRRLVRKEATTSSTQWQGKSASQVSVLS